jgi:hypothetical protein
VLSKSIPGLVLILILITGINAVEAKTVGTLEGLMKPQFLYVDTDRFYVIEKFSIFIYKLDDCTLIKKFGRMGEGPREFKGFVRLTIAKDHLFINCAGKVSFYSKDGEFINEERPSTVTWNFKPLGGDRFVGFGQAQQDKVSYRTLNLLDKDLKKIKEMSRYKYPGQRGEKINIVTVFHPTVFYTGSNRVYVRSDEDGVIDCFDSSGKRLPPITPKIEKVKFTKNDEQRLTTFFSTDHRFKARWEAYKWQVVFPDYYPLIKTFLLADGKLYVFTYKQFEPRVFECLILDGDGKLLRKSKAPILTNSAFEQDEFAYDIKNGKFYQAVENQEDETIQLHVTDL